jgi:beta-lactam-binding protein with PASTA domain
VVGLTEAAGQQAIKDAGFTTSFPNYQSFTSQPVGYILSQQPPPGTPAPRGSIVYIAVRR